MNTKITRKQNYLLLFIYAITFVFLIRIDGIYTYDTYAYLRADVHIPSGYVIFLKTFEFLFKDYFEFMVVGFQLLFAFFGIHLFLKKIVQTLQLHIGVLLVLLGVLLFPLFAPLYTANNLCSEGLTYPLYLMCIGFAMEFLFSNRNKSLFFLAITYLFLNLIRIQFVIIPILFIFIFILKHKSSIFKRTHLIQFCVLISLPFILNVLDRTYHLLKDDAFIATPFSYVNAASAAFYVSNASDANDIANEDDRLIFEKCYQLLQEKQLLYTNLDKTDSKGYYLFFHENLPKICNQTIHDFGTRYYIEQGMNSVNARYHIDQTCKRILPLLIKNNADKWSRLYYQNLVYGFKTPILLFFIVGAFLFSLIMIVRSYQKHYAILFLLSSLVLSNAMLVAFASHSIMRYHFYNYGFIFLIFITIYSIIKHGRTT